MQSHPETVHGETRIDSHNLLRGNVRLVVLTLMSEISDVGATLLSHLSQLFHYYHLDSRLEEVSYRFHVIAASGYLAIEGTNL